MHICERTVKIHQTYDLLSSLCQQKLEPWEVTEKAESDWERYYWDLAASRNKAVQLRKQVMQAEINWKQVMQAVKVSARS